MLSFAHPVFTVRDNIDTMSAQTFTQAFKDGSSAGASTASAGPKREFTVAMPPPADGTLSSLLLNAQIAWLVPDCGTSVNVNKRLHFDLFASC